MNEHLKAETLAGRDEAAKELVRNLAGCFCGDERQEHTTQGDDTFLPRKGCKRCDNWYHKPLLWSDFR